MLSLTGPLEAALLEDDFASEATKPWPAVSVIVVVAGALFFGVSGPVGGFAF